MNPRRRRIRRLERRHRQRLERLRNFTDWVSIRKGHDLQIYSGPGGPVLKGSR